jgi:1,2-diacylglycerol 3-beta-galactosyltransferase
MSESRARRLLFLFSDTGGGHRSTACAVIEALRDLYGAKVQVDLVDALADYAPWPFRHLSDIYPYMVRARGWPWAVGYRLSDGPRRIKVATRGLWPLVRSGSCRLLGDYPADAIVSYHPVLNHLTLRALAKTSSPTPLITLVTDLTATHAFWLAPGVTHCLVPTQAAHRRALACGLPAERVIVTGLPVRSSFVEAAREDHRAVRQRLGLKADRPVVLLVSGAEGMGSMYHLCRAVADSGASPQLVTIAGRNDQLRARLASEAWPLPMRVEGFVHNMHEWMRAADLLVTKAGPTTICESLVVGLPMVLSGAIPGHERPNVDYVMQAGAGVWAPTPERVLMAVRDLLSFDNRRLAQMAASARAIARPGAARRVAQAIWAVAGEGAPATAHIA